MQGANTGWSNLYNPDGLGVNRVDGNPAPEEEGIDDTPVPEEDGIADTPVNYMVHEVDDNLMEQTVADNLILHETADNPEAHVADCIAEAALHTAALRFYCLTVRRIHSKNPCFPAIGCRIYYRSYPWPP